MRAQAAVRLGFPSKRHLEVILKALEPEVSKPATRRSKANIEKENTFLILKVEARDTVALRATINAYLRWIATVHSVLSKLDSLTA